LGGLGEDSAVGTSVAIDGDDMLVGAPYYSEDSKGEGAVFVYAAGPTGWTNEIPTRILYDASAGSVQDIGNSIAFDGRYVAAAGPGDSDLGAGGEVDLFEQPVGGWAGTGDLAPAATISDSANNSGFGDSVAIQAGVLLVGQSVRAHGLNDAGAVDVYVEPAAGWATTSIPAERFTSNPAQTDSGFGTALAMVGNQIAVGADGLVGAGTADDPTGSAYVYTTYPLPKLTSVKESHSTWKRSAKLPSLDPKKAVKGGTAFHFTTNQAMPVTLSFAKRGKHGKYGASHKLKESAKSGKNVVYFDGRLTKKTKLSAGRFRVVIQAKNVAGDSTTTHTLHFTIKT
jgi:hypothetical protein